MISRDLMVATNAATATGSMVSTASNSMNRDHFAALSNVAQKFERFVRRANERELARCFNPVGRFAIWQPWSGISFIVAFTRTIYLFSPLFRSLHICNVSLVLRFGPELLHGLLLGHQIATLCSYFFVMPLGGGCLSRAILTSGIPIRLTTGP